METKTQENTLQLQRQGALSLKQAQKTVNFLLKEMSNGKALDSQMHTGKTETLFVFVANGICATFHLQAYNPEIIQEGGGA